MAGERERHRSFRGRIEGMRMMRQQDWKRIRLALPEKLPDRARDCFVPILSRSRPAQPEQLDGRAAYRYNGRFVE